MELDLDLDLGLEFECDLDKVLETDLYTDIPRGLYLVGFLFFAQTDLFCLDLIRLVLLTFLEIILAGLGVCECDLAAKVLSKLES